MEHDESLIVLGENYRVYVWRTSNEAYLSQCMWPPRQRRVAIMVWGCITHYGVGTLCLVNGNINAEKYISILENHLWPVISQHFSNKTYQFQDDNGPVHIGSILHGTTNWKIIFQLLCGQHSPQTLIYWKFVASDQRNSTKSATKHHNPWRALCCRLGHLVYFDQNYIRTLYDSISRRLLVAIKSKGHLTKY